MAEVKGHTRELKSGQVVEVKEFKTTREGAEELVQPAIPAPPDPLKKLREAPGRPPITATPGQFPGGRALPGHGAPILDNAAVGAVREEGAATREEDALEQESLEDEEDWKAEKEATKAGLLVERKAPKVAAAIDRLKKKGVKVREPKLNLTASQVGLLTLAGVEHVGGYTKVVDGKLVKVGSYVRKGDWAGAMKVALQGGPMAATKDHLEASSGQKLLGYFRGDYSHGSSDKYWESAVIEHPDGTASVSVRYGKRGNGANGQQKVTHYTSTETATVAHDKAVKTKQLSGYADDQFEQESRNGNLVHHFREASKNSQGAPVAQEKKQAGASTPKPPTPAEQPSGPSTDGVWTHPGSGAEVKVPPGGSVMRHKKVKSSYITVDAKGTPVNKISSVGTVTKAPANTIVGNYDVVQSSKSSALPKSLTLLKEASKPKAPYDKKEKTDAIPAGGASNLGTGGGGADQPDFYDELPGAVRDQLKPGDKVWSHKAGSFLVLTTSGSLTKYGPDGKPKNTSATADKLEKGHGQWTPVGAVPQPVTKTVEPPTESKPLTDLKPSQAIVISKTEEPEAKSKETPKGAKSAVPMTFNEAALEDVPKYIADDKYHFQQKVDGIRGQLVIEPGKKPWFRSKSGGQLVSGSANKITDPMLKQLGEKPQPDGPSYIVDGELLDGKWYVFDLAVEGSEKVAWADRMLIAENWVNEMHKAGLKQIQALPVARTPQEKAALWKSVSENGGEGVMMKRTDAPYDFGKRVNHTLKAKITATADVVVMARNVGQSSGQKGGTKENAEIGVYINGKLTKVGNVSTLGKEKALGKIEVGDVLEVEYLWSHPETNNISQPRIKKKRPDKDPKEATDAQLRYVNKSVVDKEKWASVTDDALEEAAKP